MAKACGDAENVELRVPCRPEYVRTVRTLVADVAYSVPLAPEAIEEVKVAASEAVANIVRHAYGGAGTAEPIIVRCWRSAGNLTVEVIDRGVGFEVPAAGTIPSPNTLREKEGGLGIFLIRSLMDSVDYWSRPSLGTRIKMTKHGWPDGRYRKHSEHTRQKAGR